MDPARRLTDPPWHDEVAAALDAASHGVAAFYAIRPREWASRFRYDLASAIDHPELEFRPGTLAQIVQLEIAGSPLPPRWRIVLRDRVIFRLARRHGLHAVLSYTLAHELVHLVRFGSGLAPFDLGEEHSRSAEEARVRRIAFDALLPVLGEGTREALLALAAPLENVPG